MRGKRNVIFPLTSVNTKGNPKWNEFIENIEFPSEGGVIPIALDKYGLNHEGALLNKNCLRSYEWPSNDKYIPVIAIGHEIFRHGFAETASSGLGIDSSIKLFLSHSKVGKTGIKVAEAVKEFVDNTNMRNFFDKTTISPGYGFDEEIENHIKDCTLVAIETDEYSTRYWCQREILCAKNNERPIVAVSCLENYEDRIFPASSNVPCVHMNPTDEIRKEDVFRIVEAAMLETIRHMHANATLENYKKIGWIDKDAEISARPVEFRHALTAKKNCKTKICYPEPPIYLDEADWHEQLGMDVFTPLWKKSQSNQLAQLRVGISISDIGDDSIYLTCLHSDHLVRLSQDVARHLLARSAILLYGGDLRKDGFTKFILEEAEILKTRLENNFNKVENHLAWPLHISGPEITEWRARYSHVMETRCYQIPDDTDKGIVIPRDIFLPPNCTKNKYIWSRCLTEMREKAILSSNARICAGGKLSGYKGKMPGVLEEILVAIDKDKPIFLLGAYGGVTGEVVKSILCGQISEPLAEEWQITHNDGYVDLQAFANGKGHSADYATICATIQSLKVEELASKAGLKKQEYERLMQSPFIDECVHLVVKGLESIAAAN
jgi:hypothetical protein